MIGKQIITRVPVFCFSSKSEIVKLPFPLYFLFIISMRSRVISSAMLLWDLFFFIFPAFVLPTPLSVISMVNMPACSFIWISMTPRSMVCNCPCSIEFSINGCVIMGGIRARLKRSSSSMSMTKLKRSSNLSFWVVRYLDKISFSMSMVINSFGEFSKIKRINREKFTRNLDVFSGVFS